jgi:hypothetical protein
MCFRQDPPSRFWMISIQIARSLYLEYKSEVSGSPMHSLSTLIQTLIGEQQAQVVAGCHDLEKPIGRSRLSA